MYNRKRNRRVIRILERILIRISVTLSIVTIGVLYWGGKNIEALEKIEENSKIDKDYIYAEREPLEVCVKEYIDSLPIPEEGINEDINIKYKKEKYMEYTEEDIEFLAQTMFAEEEEFLSMLEQNPKIVERVFKLAGSVVIHRADNNYRGATTIQEVVFSKGQYANRTLEKVTEGQEIPDIVYEWAEELLENGAIGPNNLIYQSETLQGNRYEVIGNQYFGTEPSYAE
jgi:hypothetical protein